MYSFPLQASILLVSYKRRQLDTCSRAPLPSLAVFFGKQVSTIWSVLQFPCNEEKNIKERQEDDCDSKTCSPILCLSWSLVWWEASQVSSSCSYKFITLLRMIALITLVQGTTPSVNFRRCFFLLLVPGSFTLAWTRRKSLDGESLTSWLRCELAAFVLEVIGWLSGWTNDSMKERANEQIAYM